MLHIYSNYDQLPYLPCRPPSKPSKRSLSCKSPSRLQKKLLSKTDSAIELVSERNRNSSWNEIPGLETHFQFPFSDQHWKYFSSQTITALYTDQAAEPRRGFSLRRHFSSKELPRAERCCPVFCVLLLHFSFLFWF